MEKKIVTNVEDMKKNNYFFYEDEGEDFIAICDKKTVNEAAELWKMTPEAVCAIKDAFEYLAKDLVNKLTQDLIDLYKRTELLENESIVAEWQKSAYRATERTGELERENAQLRAELDEAKGAIIRAVNVLCETRKHKGKRPCGFCQLLIPEQWRTIYLEIYAEEAK